MSDNHDHFGNSMGYETCNCKKRLRADAPPPLRHSFKVGRKYRNNPMSHIDGRYEIKVTELGRKSGLIYDNVHRPRAYIKDMMDDVKVQRIEYRRVDIDNDEWKLIFDRNLIKK